MRIETNATSGTSEEVTEKLFAGLKKEPPDFLVLCCSSAHDLDEIRSALPETSATALHGATSCLGVMTNSGMVGKSGDGIGYFALWDSSGAFGSAGASLEGDPTDAARRATQKALERAKRPGEAPDLIWVSASPGQEELILEGIEAVVGRGIPIVGGSAADNDVSGNWAVFGADGVLKDGVQISVLFCSTPLAAEYQNGYAPSGKSARVTRSEGRRLYELDDRPAADVFEELSGLSFDVAPDGEPASILSMTSYTPLGIEMGSVAGVPYYLLAHAAFLHSDRSIEFFADVELGNDLHFMTGSERSLTDRAGRVASQSLQRIGADRSPAGGLVIYCAGCMLAISEHMDQVAAGVHEGLGGAPFLGVFTFGEQGHVLNQENSHGNLMISCVTFSA